MIPNVMTDGVAPAKVSVTVWLPLGALVPGHLSSEPPPVAVHVVALVDDQVRVVAPPAVMVVGAADIFVVTGGYDQPTTTAAFWRMPPAVQLIE